MEVIKIHSYVLEETQGGGRERGRGGHKSNLKNKQLGISTHLSIPDKQTIIVGTIFIS
jgi:hypothetical protein